MSFQNVLLIAVIAVTSWDRQWCDLLLLSSRFLTRSCCSFRLPAKWQDPSLTSYLTHLQGLERRLIYVCRGKIAKFTTKAWTHTALAAAWTRSASSVLPAVNRLAICSSTAMPAFWWGTVCFLCFFDYIVLGWPFSRRSDKHTLPTWAPDAVSWLTNYARRLLRPCARLD